MVRDSNGRSRRRRVQERHGPEPGTAADGGTAVLLSSVAPSAVGGGSAPAAEFWRSVPDGKEEKMRVEWRNHLVSPADILRGKPRVKGTRIPVSLMLGYLAAGHTAGEIIVEFPDLTKEPIMACLDDARDLAAFEAAV
jgi:uncharacterized protein (DUF433 family)